MTTSVLPDPKAVKSPVPHGEAAAPPVSPSRDFARSREQMVLVMMVVVAAATAAVMRMHFNASLGSSIAGGFAAWASFMIAHLLVKRSSENGRMRLEILRLEHELARSRGPLAASSASQTTGMAQTIRAQAPVPTPAHAETRAAAKPQQQQRGPDVTEAARAGFVPASAASVSGAMPPGSMAQSSIAPSLMAPGAIGAMSMNKAGDDVPYTHAPINVDARWEQAQPQRGPAKLTQPQAQDAAPRSQPHAMGRDQGRDRAAQQSQQPQQSQRPGHSAHGPIPGAVPGSAPGGAANAPLGREQMAHMSGSQYPAAYPAAQGTPPHNHGYQSQNHQSHVQQSSGMQAHAPRQGEHGRPQLMDAPSWSGTAVAASDPLQDAWSFRPRDAAEQRIFAADAESGAASPGALPRPLEADLEMVQRKIKALADEVNAAEALKQTSPPPGAPNAIDHSIAALRSTAGRMRTPSDPQTQAGRHSGKSSTPYGAPMPPATDSRAPNMSASLPSLEALLPATAETIAGAPAMTKALSPSRDAAAASSTPPPRRDDSAAQVRPPRSSPQQQRIQEIAAAIEAGRMDVYLHPIVGLGDYAVSHFEVAVRLKNAGGSYIERPEQFLNLGATDILALFDIERLNRAATVAGQLEARGKTGAILSPTSGHAMTDANFLEAFAHTFESRAGIANQLVLTFAQADVSSFGTGTWQALDDMKSFGFRFALEYVTHLGMDFADLADKGFVFVKLPAAAFLAGMAAESGFVPAADICRHISGAGLTLVVEAVNDDETLARVFGFGALFGQGQLFGGARQISLDALGPKTAAA